MNILNTVFLRYDNQKIFYPNNILAALPISNYYRSPDMGDTIEFQTHISTPTEKIALMKERLTTYLSTAIFHYVFDNNFYVTYVAWSYCRYIDAKKEHWYSSPIICLKEVEDMNKLQWALWVTHTMNHQNMAERWVRRAILVEEMIKIFRDLDIDYRMLPVDCNVRKMPSLSSTRLPSNWSACA